MPTYLGMLETLSKSPPESVFRKTDPPLRFRGRVIASAAQHNMVFYTAVQLFCADND